MFKKLIDRFMPKRFYKSVELAAVISDCFRFENGRSAGFQSQTFMSGNTRMEDEKGNFRFFAVAEVQPCIDRLNVVIRQLERGEPVTSPDQIPLAKPRNWETRNLSAMDTIRYCFERGFAPEVAVYRLADNGIGMDIESVTFIMDALKKGKDDD